MKFARPINTKGKPANISHGFDPVRHPAIDYNYPAGTPIYASEAGRVVLANKNETRSWRANSYNDPYRIAGKVRKLITADYGNFVKIKHASGFETLYAHMKAGSVKPNIGDYVAKGQKIGEVGTTGNSSGNHLHHELRQVIMFRTFFRYLAQYFDAGFKDYRD
jgi:murein DD-endopeptidase MepM/ murein hydrolase activator NlpD